MTIERARRRGAASGIDELEWVRRWDGSPPPESYSQVTDPERYAVLRPFALALLDDLETEFDVTREESPDLSGGAAEHVDWVDAVRLRPAHPAAAALTVAFTSFPGVLVRFGRATDLVLPFCGCDACDDLVQDLADDLRFHVEAVVRGGFSEWHGTKGSGERFEVDGWGSKGSFVPTDGPPPDPGYRHEWVAWPSR
jgi:hypothetical protein